MSITTRFLKKGYTIEDFKRDELLFQEYQSFLQKSFREKKYQRKQLLLLYLLCYRYITAEQCLKLFGKNPEGKKAEYVFLGRLEREGLLRCVAATDNDLGCKIYRLSVKGKKFICNLLSGSSLNPACISFISERLSEQKQLRHYAHNLTVNNMDITLICAGEPFLSSKETVFRTNGQIIPLDELQRGSVTETGVIQVDNYLLLQKDGLRLYQEQDMATQRGTVLQEKIQKYILLCTAAGIIDNIPVFTLHSDKLGKVSGSDKKTSVVLSHKRLLEGIALSAISCLRIQGNDSRYPDWRSLPLVDLDRFYVEIIDSIMEPKYALRLKSVRKVFDYYLHEDVFTTVGSMLEQVSQQTKDVSSAENEKIQDLRKSGFIKRRSVFRGVTSSMESFSTAAIKGMSLFVITSHDIPGAFLTGFHCFSSSLISEFAPLCGIFEWEDYEYAPLELQEGNISFRNRYAFSGGPIIYLEDISADLGAWERLRYYTASLNHKDKGYLICLVDDCDLEAVRKMIDGSRYARNPDEGRLFLSFYSADAFRKGELVILKYSPGKPFSRRIL